MHGGGRSKWKSRKTSRSSVLIFFLFTLLFLLLFLFVFYEEISTFIRPVLKTSSPISTQFSQCSKTLGERFLFYAPHSGFSNQLSELKNAILMAAILNRTLIVPPVLDHHAVALGSCPKFRVLSPNELRLKVWDHAVELIKEGRLVNFFLFCASLSLQIPQFLVYLHLYLLPFELSTWYCLSSLCLCWYFLIMLRCNWHLWCGIEL